MLTGVKVGDCMQQSLAVINGDASVSDAAKAMKAKKVGSLLVIDSKKNPFAIITERDIVWKAVAKGKTGQKVRAFASRPLIRISAGADISEAAKVMRDKDVKRLVVADEGKVIGIISEKDMVRISPSLFDLIYEEEKAGWKPEYATRIAKAKRALVLPR